MSFEAKFTPSLPRTEPLPLSLSEDEERERTPPPSSPIHTPIGLPAPMHTPEKIRQVFHDIFSDVRTPDRTRVYEVIRRKQKKMVPKEAYDIPPSDNFPEVVFSGEELHRIGTQVGQGGFSMVHATVAMTFRPKPDFSPSRPKSMVVKRGREDRIRPRYEDESTRLDLTLTPDSKKRKSIDHYRRVLETHQGKFLSIHDRYDRSLDKVEYGHRKHPVSYILPRLIEAMDGLCAIHRGGSVHRDVKGENFLVMDDENVAVLTDFGFLKKVQESVHRTSGTVRYLAPFIFADFDDQIKRRGVQSQSADVFAFGRMIQQDVLVVMLKQIGDAKGIAYDDLLKAIRPEKKKVTDEILAFGRAHPERVFYQQTPKDKDDFVYIFPTAEEGRKKMEALIELFKEALPEGEIAGMKQLAALAERLQNVNQAEILSASQVFTELGLINLSLPPITEEVEIDKGYGAAAQGAFEDGEFLSIGEETLVVEGNQGFGHLPLPL